MKNASGSKSRAPVAKLALVVSSLAAAALSATPLTVHPAISCDIGGDCWVSGMGNNGTCYQGTGDCICWNGSQGGPSSLCKISQ